MKPGYWPEGMNMTSTSKNWLERAEHYPAIYYLPVSWRATAEKRSEEIPGYDLMKAKLMILDAKLMTMSADHAVWYIWDSLIADWVHEGNRRPKPFSYIEDAFRYLVNFHRPGGSKQ